VEDSYHPGCQAADPGRASGLNEKAKGFQAMIVGLVHVIQLEVAASCFQMQVSRPVPHSLLFGCPGFLFQDGCGLSRVSLGDASADSA